MPMRTSSRVDYDAIAHLYDSQPYRAKTHDPELEIFMVHRASNGPLSILDIACGTIVATYRISLSEPQHRRAGLASRLMGMAINEAGQRVLLL
jgi:hypothetical protein